MPERAGITTMHQQFEEYLQAIESTLAGYLKAPCDPGRVLEAMGYSTFGGGKRIRPILTLEFTRLCGGDWKSALPFAAGVEMVQTYSLIHDDLPCMDDDDLRRGRPSCHIAYGEATALLAGDGLLTMAFEAIASAKLPPERVVKAVGILADRIGVQGMIGGQEMDLENEGAISLPLETVRRTNEKKTSALLSAACRMGVAAAGGTEEQFAAADRFARNFGLAFQVIDDILDLTADAAVLGKPVGSDLANEKVTYPSILGLEGAREYARRYTDEAVEAMSTFAESGILTDYTRGMLDRIR